MQGGEIVIINVVKNKPLLIPYITAGFPDKKFFAPALKTLSESGADFIEVGVPHSDPLADGPTIQEASKVALENGVNLNWIIEACCGISQQKVKPLILFSYFNPILKYGLEKLLRDLPKPLFYGLIIPDLPLEEAQRYLPIFKKHKLNLILLAAPTTKKEKLKKISALSGGIIYMVSVAGVTGARKALSGNLKNKIKQIKSFTKKPVVVGFGISTAKHVKQMTSYGADGVVFGSALIKSIMQSKDGQRLSALKKLLNSIKS